MQAGGQTKPSQGPDEVENILLHVPFPSHRSVAPFLSHLPWWPPSMVGTADLFHRAPYWAHRLRLLRPVEHPRRLGSGHDGVVKPMVASGSAVYLGRFHPFLTHHKYPACPWIISISPSHTIYLQHDGGVDIIRSPLRVRGVFWGRVFICKTIRSDACPFFFPLVSRCWSPAVCAIEQSCFRCLGHKRYHSGDGSGWEYPIYRWWFYLRGSKC